MARKPAMSIDADFSEGYEFAGLVSGMTSTVSTNRFTSSVLEMAHAILAKDFDETMDVMALANPGAYHHVYEWRMVGLPKGRLWRHTMSGRGAERVASWEWVASRMPILTPEERKSDPLGVNDPMQGVTEEQISKLSGRTYFFYWKAPMMEYDLPARVRPRYAKRLFIPTWRAKGNFRFGMETYQEFSSGNPQDASGGPGTVGRFTSAWTGWWAGTAPARFDETVRKVVENDLGVGMRELIRSKRKRRKTVGLKTINDDFAAFESGRNRAAAYVTGKAKSYKQASKYIDRNGIFGIDVNYNG